MINVGFQVRRAVERDYDRIANLIYYESNSHRHLDWHSPLEWLGGSNYWVCEENRNITAALVCPEDPPQVAWIRFFGHQQHLPASRAWSALWKVARSEIALTGRQIHVAAIVVRNWFQSLLLESGFILKQDIVLLEWKNQGVDAFPVPSGIRIRPMQDADMSAIARVDLTAFGPFWHNTEAVLQKARLQCASAMIAEDDTGVIGYQLSTKNPLGAHLARLAVDPRSQGRGVGTALVSQLLQSFDAAQLSRFSVNTQSDNATSLALYKKVGFVRTGEYFPVLVYPIG
jgi:ribosomal protein S18 acetylase RimI-like enzyme